MTKYQLLPPLSTEEFTALRVDIEANGLLQPIEVDEDGEILDGYHRAAIRPDGKRLIVEGLSEAEKRAYPLRVNTTRRNLSSEQRKQLKEQKRAIANELRSEDPKKNTQVRVANLLGVTQQSISFWWGNDTNACTSSSPNASVKIAKAEHDTLTSRLDDGEATENVAADYGITTRRANQIASKRRKEKAEEQHKRDEAQAAKEQCAHITDVMDGDFRQIAETIPSASVDLIFTDPPYDRDSAGMYVELAEIASHVLVQGGSLMCYAGHYLLPELFAGMTKHLRFWWMCGCQHGGKCARMTEYGVIVKWKPILWFVKGTREDKETYVDDLIAGKREKDTHIWQQALNEAIYYIDKLTNDTGRVWEPFCGSGTTCVAAEQLGRQWSACEIDEDTAALARRRINDLCTHGPSNS